MCPWVDLIFLGFWILIYKVGMLTFYYYPLLLLFSRSVMADSLQPHGLQHARVPCPSPSPGVCLNSCPLSRWCYLSISSSAAIVSSCLQSFPASGSFPMSRLFASGGQSIGASASVLQWIFRIDFPIRIYKVPVLSAQGTLKSLFQHQSSKASIL